MKGLFYLIGLFLLTGFSMVFAQEAAEAVQVVTNKELLDLLMESIGGVKGASTLVVVGIVIKFLLAFLNSEAGGKVFKNLKGSVKLLIVTGLSMVGGVVGLISVNGLDFGAALVHSTTLSAFMVFANQLYKQFVEKKD